jgi:hypothetical protein
VRSPDRYGVSGPLASLDDRAHIVTRLPFNAAHGGGCDGHRRRRLSAAHTRFRHRRSRCLDSRRVGRHGADQCGRAGMGCRRATAFLESSGRPLGASEHGAHLGGRDRIRAASRCPDPDGKGELRCHRFRRCLAMEVPLQPCGHVPSGTLDQDAHRSPVSAEPPVTGIRERRESPSVSSSWLNLVEPWVQEVTERRLRRACSPASVFSSMVCAAGPSAGTRTPSRASGTVTAEEIITKVRRRRAALTKVPHAPLGASTLAL